METLSGLVLAWPLDIYLNATGMATTKVARGEIAADREHPAKTLFTKSQLAMLVLPMDL